tara:strand:- start:19607 stop:20344 length:738 start_codon:yes stop_codon:yes gene_type:complete
MRWTDLKSVIVEADERVIIAVEFQSGKQITIANVPKALTLKPDFETQVKKKAQKAKPNEVFSSWSEVNQKEADKINASDSPESYEPDEEEKLDMKNVQLLHTLILDTMDNSVRKGLKYTPNYQSDEPMYVKRSVDPEFPAGISYEYTRGGKKYKINDIKQELGITVIINTKTPKKDEYGYTHGEGWPVMVSDYDDMKQMIIDTCNARENITTVAPADNKQEPGGKLRIKISPKNFYYRKAEAVPG